MGRVTKRNATHKNEGSVEVLVVLHDIVCIVLHCFLLVHRIEIDARIVGLDGLEELSEGILEAASAQGQRPKQCSVLNVPLWVYL